MKDGSFEHMVLSWDALNGLCGKSCFDLTLVGRCSEAGVNVFSCSGNVWCPWEVGCPKGERAGSNPVTSDLSPHLRHFLLNLKEY